MSYASVVKAQRAQRNRAYVRELLRQRQPALAAALESAEQYLSCALARGNDAGLMMAHETCHLADSLTAGRYRGALLDRGADRGQRHLWGHGHDRGELVDEPSGRPRAAEQPDHLSQCLAEADACVPRVPQGRSPQASRR